MEHDPVTICYLGTLIFLCAVMAVLVFGPREAVVTLFLKHTLRMYIIVMFLSIVAGGVALLLWARLGRPAP